MKPYDHKKIEPKWQKKWDKEQIYKAKDLKKDSKQEKFYSLIEFPYPSGLGLHIGHIRSNTAMDIISRKRRAEGFNVLYPIGWDAFGLPTENYAIKTGIQPKIVTKKNTDVFRKQLKALGFSFDWSREINTTDPKYYKWTQWLFLQFYKHELAYKKKMLINWCPKDKIGLANEEVIDGCCERCGTPVEKREKDQWMLAITKYADRLDKDLDTVDYLPHIKTQQRNWIGRKETVVDGKTEVTYNIRDWIFSRQRYWGEPIPMIFCASCEAKNGNGWVPVPEKNLPVKLPNVKKYEPTDNGESPLASITKWVNVKCPVCKSPAKRETDTMPNWAGSSWYFLRYADPKNSKAFADSKKLAYWAPVNWYNGGMEHTTLHLLYSRFWNKFLFDIGLAPTSEPYMKRTSHGLILAESGEKMSKSKGNATSPDELVATYGADTLRLYEMFIGPFDQPVMWNSEAIIGPRRFLERVWKLAEKVESTTPPRKLGTPPPQGGEDNKNNPPSSTRRGLGGGVEHALHKTIKKVSDSIEKMEFNVAVSALMILVNEIDKEETISKSHYQVLLQLLAPFTPHITEELWNMMGNKKSITLESWPKFDESKIKDETVRIAVQVDGKLRDEVEVPTDSTEEHVKGIVLELPTVKKWLEGREIKKVIYIKNRLVNII